MPLGVGHAFEGAYLYANNRPTVMVDPSGERSQAMQLTPIADTGPNLEQDLRGYHYEFELSWGYWSAERLWGEFLDGLDEFPFPFEKCGGRLRKGTDCYVNAFAFSSPIRVVDVGPVSMTFLSLKGHPEGAGNLVTFQVLETRRLGNLRSLSLVADSSGPYNGVAAQSMDPRKTSASNRFFSRRSWSLFAGNLAALNHQSFSRR